MYKIKGVFKRSFILKGTENQLNFTVSIHTSVKQKYPTNPLTIHWHNQNQNKEYISLELRTVGIKNVAHPYYTFHEH